MKEDAENRENNPSRHHNMALTREITQLQEIFLSILLIFHENGREKHGLMILDFRVRRTNLRDRMIDCLDPVRGSWIVQSQNRILVVEA